MKISRIDLRNLIFEMIYPDGLSPDHPDYDKFLRDRRKGAGIPEKSIDKLAQLDLEDPDMSNALAQGLGSLEPDTKPLSGPVSYYENYSTPEDLGFNAYQAYKGSLNRMSFMVGYNKGEDDAALEKEEKSVDYLIDRYGEDYAIGYGHGYYDMSQPAV